MSAMLGRSGAWYYGRPGGETSRIMRRSGRQREARAAEDQVREEREPDPFESQNCPYGCCHSIWSFWGDPWPFD